MNKLRFQTRLLLGFSIVLLFVFIIVSLAIRQIQSISSDTELIYNHPFTVSNAVRDINVNINAIHRSMKDVALSENDEQLNKSVLHVNYYDSLIYVAFEIIEERFLGDKKIIYDTYKTYAGWETIRNEVIELKKAGSEKEAAKITKGKGADYVELLFAKTKVLTDFAQNKADEFFENTNNSEKKSTIILLLIMSALILLSIIISILISRSLSKPIHKFISEMKLIYQKSEQNKQKFSEVSEQEILDNTGKELKAAYAEIEKFNQELEQKIEQRTKELKEQNEEYASLNEEYKTQNLELLYAKEKAEESDHLKSAFLANMSHEIRTPMNSILGFSRLLKRKNLSNEKKDEYLEFVESGGTKLLNIITDIIDISKIDVNQLSINLEAVNLNDLMNNLKGQFSLQITNKELTLSCINSLPDEKSIIQTDQTRLSQILSNLIENAQKFTKRGHVEFGYTINNKLLQFYVKDTGIGIPRDKHKLIFERFSQIDHKDSRTSSGTGLGLSIVKGLVQLLNGEIWVDSELNKGSTFYFTIPFIPVEEPKNVESSILLKPEANNNVTVLIVEDEFLNFTYLEALFEDYKYNIIHKENGKEAVELFKYKNSIDLVLMDIKMPVMNGLEATREIRKKNKTVPIVAQTAHAMAEDRKTSIKAGCNDYIVKPITEEKITEIINTYIK